MLISVCIPCGNRLRDLKVTLPTVIEAANNSPPVEIVVLDYNSSDNVAGFIRETQLGTRWENGTKLEYRRYGDGGHYHMAHARNLSVVASKGDYVLTASADLLMRADYLESVRAAAEQGYIWIHHPEKFVGVVCVLREEFMAAGGFDERFEFYGKEDKDLFLRLKRRGASHCEIPARLLNRPTPWPDKIKNYRLPLSRREMSKLSKAIYQENIDAGVLVANEGKEWRR